MYAKSEQSQAYAGLILVTLIIGFSFIFVKIGLNYSDAMDLLAHRFTAAALSIFVLRVFGLINIPRPTLEKFWLLLLLSLFYPLLLFALQTYGLLYSTASEGGIIFASLPILTLIAATIFLKEKTTLLQTIGIVLTIAGVLYIVVSTSGNGGHSSLKGILLLVGSVCSMVVYYILGKKIGPQFSAMEITVWMTLLAFVVFNTLSISTHLRAGTLHYFMEPLKHGEFLGAVLYLGVLSSMLTAFLTNYALSQIPASHISVFNNLSPLVTILAGVIILGDRLYHFHIIGGILVLVGVVMTVFLKK